MSDFLFCFLKPDPRKHAVHQRRHYLVCRKEGCGYLDESGPERECTCPPTIEYYAPFKKKPVKGGQHPEEPEETGEEVVSETVEKEPAPAAD